MFKYFTEASPQAAFSAAKTTATNPAADTPQDKARIAAKIATLSPKAQFNIGFNASSCHHAIRAGLVGPTP